LGENGFEPLAGALLPDGTLFSTVFKTTSASDVVDSLLLLPRRCSRIERACEDSTMILVQGLRGVSAQDCTASILGLPLLQLACS
jgi:hypothetical protein